MSPLITEEGGGRYTATLIGTNPNSIAWRNQATKAIIAILGYVGIKSKQDFIFLPIFWKILKLG